MKNKLQDYTDSLKELVYKKICREINFNTQSKVFEEDLKKPFLDRESPGSQVYYFKILKNKEYYFKESNFFSEFKKNYKLQGIDNE